MRPTFVDATLTFRDFLRSQSWPTDIRWLTANRVLRWRSVRWLFRPEEATDEGASAAFYERLRQSPSSIRIDGLAAVSGCTFAYVEDFGGESRKLNFGVVTDSPSVRIVHSEFRWRLLQLALGLLPRRSKPPAVLITPAHRR